MIDFNLAISTLIHKHFVLNKLSGHEKVLIVGALLARGTTETGFDTISIKSEWRKSVLGVNFNGIYVARAVQKGWLSPVSKTEFCVTEDGYSYLENINKFEAKAGTIGMSNSQGLMLFAAGETHSFDKYIRQLLLSATSYVRIVDSYVDERVFDNLLDQIPKTARIRLLYGKSHNVFDQRALRFGREFSKFMMKQKNGLHDRFIIIDSAAYILGPSLKDAADRSPATLVKLGVKDSERLIKFFEDLWKSV